MVNSCSYGSQLSSLPITAYVYLLSFHRVFHSWCGIFWLAVTYFLFTVFKSAVHSLLFL